LDFFARQAAARRQTRWLIVAFLVAVALVVVAIDAVVLFFLGLDAGLGPLELAAESPAAALSVALVVLLVIGCASLYRTFSLRDGGGAVARGLGGVRVERGAADPALQRLHNVVEEMSIASGVPMPEVYLLEHETGINAFAAGLTPADAAIAVTRGAADNLGRAELQGVVAHEFSHILNGDMRLNLRLIGWLFGLMVLSLIGRLVLRGMRRSRGKNGGAIVAVAFALLVFGWLGLTLGRLIQAAVSRHRERLADASAVQFTRDPGGLKGALVKIAGVATGSKLGAAGAEEVAHMLFAPGVDRLLATHPPLTERILALDPSFDVRRLPQAAAEALGEVAMPDAAGEVAGVGASAVPLAGAVPLTGSPVPADPAAVVAQIGRPATVHVRQAHEIRIALPEELRTFVESPARASAVMLALLVSRTPGVRDWQLARLGEVAGDATRAAVDEVLPATARLAPMLRLPAVLQAYPALRHLAPEERRRLAGLIDDLSRADARIDAFEFCLARLVNGALRDDVETRRPHGRGTLDGVTGEVALLFAVTAFHGAADERAAREAYEMGIQRVLPRVRPACEMPGDWPARLATALDALAALRPFAKQALIEGLVATVAHDGQVAVSEAELLRTVCVVLHCPLPPLLPSLPSLP